MRHSVDMEGLTSKPFVPSSRHAGQNYNATIQNNTGQSLTVTATNENVLKNGVAGANFAQPAQGALVITAGASGSLTEPYVCLNLTLAGAGSAGDTIDIMEVG